MLNWTTLSCYKTCCIDVANHLCTNWWHVVLHLSSTADVGDCKSWTLRCWSPCCSHLLCWFGTCWHQGVVWAPPSTVDLGVSLTYSMDCLSQWCWLHLHHPCWYPPCWCFSGTCWSQPGRCRSHCCLRPTYQGFVVAEIQAIHLEGCVEWP